MRTVTAGVGLCVLAASVMLTGQKPVLGSMPIPQATSIAAGEASSARPIVKIQTAEAAQSSAVPKREQTPPVAALLTIANPAAGEAYVKKVCAACHSLDEGGKALIGPNLYGVVGGPYAHMEGFNYSDALKSKHGRWTYDELFAWLTKPSNYAPGTRMAFPGIKNDKLRIDVIAYLRTLSHTPEPLPAAQPQ